MTSFLFTITFLLNIILLVIVFYLFKQVESLKDGNINDFTEITDAFLEEIKRENEHLQASVLTHSSQEKPKHNNSSYPRTQYVEKEINTEVIDLATSDIDHMEVNEIDDQLETSLQANVLQLHNEGMPTNKIAKQLNCGTTEASLIIKLQGKV